MTENNRKQQSRDEGLKSLLLRARTTSPRFRMPFLAEDTERMMLAAYEAEVESRGNAFLDDDHIRNVIAIVSRELSGNMPKAGMFLCGMCGNGKTTMLLAFQNLLNLLTDRGYFKMLNDYGLQTRISVKSAVDIMDMARDDKRSYRMLRERSMLAIDDLGREDVNLREYGNNTSPIIDLIEFRYREQLFTAVSSNLTPREITEKYGIRVADRFREMFIVVPFTKETSYRK